MRLNCRKLKKKPQQLIIINSHEVLSLEWGGGKECQGCGEEMSFLRCTITCSSAPGTWKLHQGELCIRDVTFMCRLSDLAEIYPLAKKINLFPMW